MSYFTKYFREYWAIYWSIESALRPPLTLINRISYNNKQLHGWQDYYGEKRNLNKKKNTFLLRWFSASSEEVWPTPAAVAGGGAGGDDWCFDVEYFRKRGDGGVAACSSKLSRIILTLRRDLALSPAPLWVQGSWRTAVFHRLIPFCSPVSLRSASIMIKAILIFNNHGKPRLSKFYEHYVSNTRFCWLLIKHFVVLKSFFRVIERPRWKSQLKMWCCGCSDTFFFFFTRR